MFEQLQQCIHPNFVEKTLIKIKMDTEKLLNRISMITLLITGLIFIYEGIKYIYMKQQNPELPDKLYAAGILALIVGVAEIVFAIVHFFF